MSYDGIALIALSVGVKYTSISCLWTQVKPILNRGLLFNEPIPNFLTLVKTKALSSFLFTLVQATSMFTYKLFIKSESIIEWSGKVWYAVKKDT